MTLLRRFQKWLAERRLVRISIDLAVSREYLDELESAYYALGYSRDDLLEDILHERSRVAALEEEQRQAQGHFALFS